MSVLSGAGSFPSDTAFSSRTASADSATASSGAATAVAEPHRPAASDSQLAPVGLSGAPELPSASPGSASSSLPARYRRLRGEPTLSFFRRERNSLSAYCRPTLDGSALQEGGVEEEWDAAMDLLERRAVMSGAVRDEAARGGYLGNDLRYEVRNQRVQRQRRQSVKQQRATQMMQTLKYLLTMKRK